MDYLHLKKELLGYFSLFRSTCIFEPNLQAKKVKLLGYFYFQQFYLYLG
jgi:hypothetical protein